MAQDIDTMIRLAKTILDFNWTGQYTKPGPRLYPHQWSWDSALIAIGYARYASAVGGRNVLDLRLDRRRRLRLLPDS